MTENRASYVVAPPLEVSRKRDILASTAPIQYGVSMDADNPIFHIPAHVRRIEPVRATALLELVKNDHAYDPTIFEERAPFFWSAEISNDQIDFYYTHMLPNTLANFAADAKSGVSFQNSHRTREMPLARSIDGRVETHGERLRTVADFYTLPGLRLTEVNTDDLIGGIRSGIVKDVSVGFSAWDKISCDICGRSYFDWDCPHIPGMKYEVKGADDVMRVMVSTFSVDNAHLNEVSAAYDGATPDAMILKAERMAGAGLLKPEAAAMIEQRYRIKLPGANRAWSGYTAPEKGSKMTADEQLQQLHDALRDAGYDADDLPASTAKLIEDVQTAAEQRATLEAEAADGRSYRADLIAESLAEGVRAYGDKFSRATYEATLKAAPLATIRQMRDDWRTVAADRLQGGRQTTDAAQPAKPTTSVAAVPDSAFRS